MDTLYGGSDGLIKHRQKMVDTKDKLKKAEKEAFRIMQEKDKKKEMVDKVLAKRGGFDADWEGLWEWIE